jgi:hypothetical protein
MPSLLVCGSMRPCVVGVGIYAYTYTYVYVYIYA